MAKKATDKTAQKRALLAERTARVFDCSEAEAIALLSQELRQSVRVNLLHNSNLAGDEGFEPPITRPEPVALVSDHSLVMTRIEWASDCYDFTGEKALLTHSQAFANGQIYLQNKASFIPPILLDPKPGERILDVCAAPGGKTSHIAALAQNKAEIWANDNSKARLAKMRANFSRLHVEAQTTLVNIEHLLGQRSPYAGQQFDKILLDAPCSGEGLLQINRDKDLTYWSVAQIKRLATLQKRALRNAWQLLRPGGTLVYSTCTIAPEENEAVIQYFLKHTPEAQLQPISLLIAERWPALDSWQGHTFAPEVAQTLRIKPANGVEAFFVAQLTKNEEA